MGVYAKIVIFQPFPGILFNPVGAYLKGGGIVKNDIMGLFEGRLD